MCIPDQRNICLKCNVLLLMGSSELVGGGGGPRAQNTCWLLPYSQFTVTLTCLTSAEETSLAALHSYLPDCSLVMPRISRYSSSPSNSLPEKTGVYMIVLHSLKYAALFLSRSHKSTWLFSILTMCLSEVRFHRSRPGDRKSRESD